MKPNLFKQSVLAVGVVTAMGIAGTAAIAATSGTAGETTTKVTITNKASANYSVGDVAQPKVDSNIVTITVSEQVSFSLTANNADGNKGDDLNENEKVAPNGFVLFEHTLTNTGNRQDEYTVSLENVTGDDSQYNLAESTFSYQIYNADNNAATTPQNSGTNLNVATFNNVKFKLEAGQYVDFTISAKTNGNKGGNKQDLLLSATSTELTGNTTAGVKKTLTNTDSSITKLPSFSIVKTMTNGLDLNNKSDTASYKIQIKNITSGFSTAATNVKIEDFLPAGLVLAEGLTAADITVSSSATKGTIATSSAGDNGFSITGVNIPVDGVITIDFKVIQGGAGTLDPANALNHVNVTDDLDDNADTDNTLVDSTKTANEKNVTEFYPDSETNYTNGTTAGLDDANDSTQPLLTIRRNVTLTKKTTGEIPSTSDSADGSNTANRVTHESIITNSGQDVEGDKSGELTFTITENASNSAVNFDPNSVTITYDADGDLTTTGDQTKVSISPTTTNGNKYDLNSVFGANGLPAGMASGSKVVINYEVKSESAVIGSEDSTTVTLDSTGEGASAQGSITDTTYVRGIDLVKTQSLDANCDGTSDNGTFVRTNIAAEPTQCVIYQIKAENTFSSLNITNLLISDKISNFSNGATVFEKTSGVYGSITAGSGSKITDSTVKKNASNATIGEEAVYATVDTLAANEKATLQFAIKIKTDR